MKPQISIIIPVKNGEKTIDACLKAIYEQTLIDKTEVIIIDSGSVDNTLDIIKKYPVRLYQIPPNEFGHGKTRNYGVSLAKGEFIVMTVQDARPAANTWLELMTQHFDKKHVAGICGQQAVPHEKDKNPLQWFRPISKPSYSESKFFKSEFQQMTPKEQWQNCNWDNVNASYRKSSLIEMPFSDAEFGEDMIWAKQALIREHTLIFDSRSLVWHYHHYDNKVKITERIFHSYTLVFNTFGYIRPNPYTLKRMILTLYHCAKYKVIPYWWFYNLRLNLFSHFAVNKIIKRLSKAEI